MEDTDWEDHKAEIKRLYIRQDKSLKEVMKILRKRRNFHKTKKQYENVFKEWGFRKNKLTPDKWKIINRKIKKRKRETGGDIEVYIDGIRYPPAKVQAGISRHGFISAAEMYSVPSPEMPEGILVCSPISVTVLQWSHSLPWFQFLKRVNVQESRVSPTALSSAVLPVDRHRHPLATHDMIQSLVSILPHHSLQKKSNIDEGVQLDKVLKVLMPEEQDEEHRIMSEVLCGHRNDMGLQERFKLLFYFLSNNFRLIKGAGPGHIHEMFGMMGIEEMRDTEREDELILNILRSSRLNTLENMNHLFAMPGLTPGVIAEKLFGSAARSFDMETVTVMLKAGMDPQTLILTDNRGSITPLEYFCAEKLSVDMVNLLLSHNADVNKYQESPVLLSAIFTRNKDLINVFLSHGADICVCLEELKSAAEDGELESEDLDFLKPFLDYLPIRDIDAKDRERSLASMLRLSVRTWDVEWVGMLLALGADVNSIHEVKFESGYFQTTALGLAAEQGATEIIQVLYIADATLNPTSTGSANIVHPLTLAVAHSDFDAIVLLISCGGDINTSDHFSTSRKTLFDRALEKGDLEICNFLLYAGAVVEENVLQSFYNKSLWSLVGANDVDSILQLPLQQIDMNRTYSGILKTALGRAIELGNFSVIEILLNAGATNVGRMIARIGGLEMAKYLDSVGLLPKILGSSGQDILTAAIITDDYPLVEYLLHSSADQMSENITEGQSRWHGTPLEAAITQGKLATFEALLVHGARITDGELTRAVKRALEAGDDLFLRRIVSLQSPLKFNAPKAMSLAVAKRNHALVNILLDSGIDPRDEKSSRDSRTILEMTAMMDDDDLFQIIFMSAEWSKEALGRSFTASIWQHKSGRMQYLRDAGADLNQGILKGDGFWFPLQIAVVRKDISLIKTLIDYGCDPDKSDKFRDMRTPLQSAAGDGNIKIVNLLLEAGADLDGEPICDGTTALQLAVKRGNMELVERLLDAGADVNSAPDPYCGATALQFAAIQGFIGISRRLLEEGADVNAGRAPTQGRTALEGAAEHGRLDMLQLLLSHGALIEEHGRRQYIRAVKLAEWNAHSTIAKFLRSHGQWTALDSQRSDLEAYEVDGKSEPDYENDLAWNYEVPWDLMTKIRQRPVFRQRAFP